MAGPGIIFALPPPCVESPRLIDVGRFHLFKTCAAFSTVICTRTSTIFASLTHTDYKYYTGNITEPYIFVFFFVKKKQTPKTLNSIPNVRMPSITLIVSTNDSQFEKCLSCKYNVLVNITICVGIFYVMSVFPTENKTIYCKFTSFKISF